MNQTTEEILRKLERIKKLEKIYGICVVSSMLLILLGVFVLDNLTVVFIGMIPAVAAVLILSPQIKCPYCGKYIRLKFSLPKTCPRCGKDLQ